MVTDGGNGATVLEFSSLFLEEQILSLTLLQSLVYTQNYPAKASLHNIVSPCLHLMYQEITNKCCQ
jgi:hypothetical protein